MTSAALALCLSGLLLWKIVQTADPSTVHRERSFISADVGDSLSLKCFRHPKLPEKIFWYKQPLGERPRLIHTFETYEDSIFHEEFKNNKRFTIDTEKDKNHLKIADLQISDSATYMCVNSYYGTFNLSESVTVIVKLPGSNIKTLVHQSSSPSVQPGGSVTLSCSVHTGTCDEEHSVYWFKQAEESHPGLLYTSGSRTDRCESNSTSCVYNLSMKNLNQSHAGTYYCAVASCGHILFGNGTKLDVEDDFMAYFWKGAFAFSTILSVILAFSVFMMNKSKCHQPPEFSAGLSSYPEDEGCRPTESLYCATVSVNLSNRSGRQRDPTWTETVYHCVKK